VGAKAFETFDESEKRVIYRSIKLSMAKEAAKAQIYSNEVFKVSLAEENLRNVEMYQTMLN
jgi:hypothetical protein